MAAAWVVREQDGLNEREKRNLVQWCEQNPHAFKALEGARQAWDRFDCVEGSDAFDDLLGPSSRSRFARIRWASVAAFILLSTIGVIWGVWEFKGPIPGQVQSARTIASWKNIDWIELQDHSTIELNAGAVVEYALDKHFRKVWVRSGEAYFTVAPDPQRPFVVLAGNTRSEAVGTQFNVKLGAQSVEVLVTEGKVHFSVAKGFSSGEEVSGSIAEEALLLVNYQATVAEAEEGARGIVIREVTDSERSHAIEWKPVTLRFDSAQLADVVAEFNRYNTVQMVIADPEIAGIRIVAKFRSNNLQSFLRLLEVTSGISAVREGEVILLSSADPASLYQ